MRQGMAPVATDGLYLSTQITHHTGTGGGGGGGGSGEGVTHLLLQLGHADIHGRSTSLSQPLHLPRMLHKHTARRGCDAHDLEASVPQAAARRLRFGVHRPNCVEYGDRGFGGGGPAQRVNARKPIPANKIGRERCTQQHLRAASTASWVSSLRKALEVCS